MKEETIEISGKEYTKVVEKMVEIEDGVEQVCMNGVQAPSEVPQEEKSLVVTEHTNEDVLHAITEDDEIYASDWKKRVVIITGASCGIGLETARRFVLYADVVYNLDLVRQDDDNINFIKTDITNPESVANALQKIWDKEDQIDIVINNAGIGFAGSAEGATLAEIEKIINTNFIGTAIVSAAVIPYLREQKRGKIIQIATQTGIRPKLFQSLYNASKAATIAYSKTLASEVKPFNIKVTSIIFSNVKTTFTESRVKNKEDDKVYKYRLAKAISRAEYDEQNGKEPEWVARKLFTLSNKRKFKPVTIFGAKERGGYFFRKRGKVKG